MKLSIIISNRNDTSMLVVTIRSCLEALKGLNAPSEIVIADNSDPKVFQTLGAIIPRGYLTDGTLKIHRQNFPCLFTARELAAEKAKGEYILCVDSHMLIGHNTIPDLVYFMDDHKDDPTLGFAHAPVSWAHHHERNAKHDRVIRKGELGTWGARYDTPRTITWKGMPWICRREWFLDTDKGLNGYGALAQHKVSWGGGDMHIGTKPWLLGFKNWAVPTDPCIHIGPFPKIDTGKDPNHTKVVNPANVERYRLYSSSGQFPHTFGFLLSCYVLGGEPMMRRNLDDLKRLFGRYINYDDFWDKAIELGQDEKQWLDERKVMTFEQFTKDEPWRHCC